MKILTFFAHPDDETMFCGGTLALLAKQGAAVNYLCATRGEGGELGEPPVCTRDELGHARQEEMACAVKALDGRQLVFLDYQDPLIGQDESLHPYAEDPDEVAEKVVEVIHSMRPHALITHGVNGEYGHPAHLLSHQAARRAVTRLGEAAPSLYSVSANFPGHPKPRHINRDQNAHIVLDVSTVMEQKVQAALCHRSQQALFVRRASQAAGRQVSVPEVLVSLESLHRVYPPVEAEIDGPLPALLAPWRVEPNGG